MQPTPFGDLSQKSAVVTGASTGIGRAIALELARGGANVLIHYRSSEKAAEELAEECRGLGVEADAIAVDFEDEIAVRLFPETVWGILGKVDILVNNAGVDLLTGTGRQQSFDDKLTQLFEVDVRCTLLFSRDIGQRMKEAGGGVILNIGWDQADRGMEGDSGELFAASKNAIMGFTRSLAVSLAPKVRVNCIAPGWIRTAWGAGAPEVWQERVLRETPLGRWGLPEDIAWLARFLVSDQAAYLTGQVINANGGAVR
jgi:3-oxoacyl-[acyl-carrier protein] reductase